MSSSARASAARTQEQSTARRRVRRTRQLVALLAILLVVASVSLVSAVRAQNSATGQRNAAVLGSALSEANELRDADPALSLQLTLAAYRADPSPRARDALLNSLDTPYASHIEAGEMFADAAVLSPDGALLVVPGYPRTGLWDVSDHYRPQRLPDVLPSAEVAAFGPDRTLLIRTQKGTYDLWDLREPRRPRLLTSLGSEASLAAPIRSAVAYSRDGRATATIDNDGTARLWDITNQTRPRLRAQLMSRVDGRGDAEAALGFVAFSPHGEWLAVANSTHTVHLWDLTEGRARRLAVLPGDTAAFTSDGRTLAVAGRHGSVQLWDLAASRAPQRLATFANRGDVLSLAFSAGTGLLAVGDLSGSVSLWNVGDLRRPVPLTDLVGQLPGGWSTAFGPRGDTLFAADHGSVWIWDLGTVLVSHPDAVTTVRLNHRGDLLATGGRDHTVRLWRVDGERSRQLATIDVPYTPGSLSISPDDRTLLLDGRGPTQVWDIATPDRPVRAAILPETWNNGALAFSPTDATVAISEGEGFRIRVYDLADPYHPKVVDDLALFAVSALAFHPNGKTMAAARNSFTELWDLGAPVVSRRLAVRPTPDGSVATFGPDGRTVTLFLNGTREIQLLGISDPRNPDVLATFHPRVHVDRRLADGPPAIYSADSRSLAVLDSDRTVRLWDISDPREPASVTAFDFGHRVAALSMSADGRQLFAATENVVQRRYLDVEDVAKRICAIAYPRISEADWRRHFPNLPYQPPCG